MHKPTRVTRSPSHPERRYRRFKLRYPVHLLFRSGELVTEVNAMSQDVSIGGLLLACSVPIPKGSAVDFVISLRARKLRPVQLIGEGRVVRVERSRAQAEFAIAVECKNSISQIEAYLPAEAS